MIARVGPDGEQRLAAQGEWVPTKIVSDIANRLDVAVSTVESWPERYNDWPEPLVLGAQQRTGAHGRQAVYWWPDIQAFLARHDFPRGPHGAKKQ